MYLSAIKAAQIIGVTRGTVYFRIKRDKKIKTIGKDHQMKVNMIDLKNHIPKGRGKAKRNHFNKFKRLRPVKKVQDFYTPLEHLVA